jgi:predicted nucleic-acid-binding protein
LIALDTNVLVRVLVEDDPEQTARAAALLDRLIAADEAGFVSDVALCEVVWVLRDRYRVSRRETAEVVGRLLRARHLRFSSSERLARALASFRSGQGDFADYVIQQQSRAAGAEVVITFDGDLLKETGFAAP